MGITGTTFEVDDKEKARTEAYAARVAPFGITG